MKQKFYAGIYKWIVYLLVLAPNIFASIVGVESFPFTSAPMFGHYVGEETGLYLLKFEALSGAEYIDLEPYYDRPESYFIRHFFSKVYGGTGNISAFNGRLSENPEKFQARMNTFFDDFTNYALEHHELQIQKINLKAIKVDKDRKPLAEPLLIGYYDIQTNEYKSLYGADK